MLKLRRPLALLLLAAAVLSAGCFKSKNVVKKVKSDEDVKLDGVPYALPRTVVQVRLPFKRSETKKGQFERYAPCFFPQEIAAGRVRAGEVKFRMEPPVFSSTGEPDPDEHYVAKIKGGYFENKTMDLAFNADGVITKGEASSENKAVDFAIKAARTAISVASKGFTPRAERGQEEEGLAERAERVDICRSMLVVDAASVAAGLAKDLAEAVKKPEAVEAAKKARELVTQAESQIAAHQEEARSRLAARTVARPSDTRGERGQENTTAGTVPAGQFTAVPSELLAAVVKLTDEARKEVEKVAAAAETAAATPEMKPEEAKSLKDSAAAVRKAGAHITETVKLVGNNDPKTVEYRVFANGFESADRINNRLAVLRLQRENLTSGDSPPQNLSAEALKLLIDQADAAVTRYEKAYFLGTEDAESWSGDFRFVPIKADPFGTNVYQTSPVLLVQVKDGLCPTPESIKLGVTIKPTFVSKGCPDPGGIPEGGAGIWLRVSRVTDHDNFLKSMVEANAREEVRGERGFYYRIPATAVVTLIKGKSQPAARQEPPAKDIVARDRMRVAQLGVTASLPASAAGRKTQYTIDFDEATGAMKNFKLLSNAMLEATLADEAGGAATDIITAKQASDAARDARRKASAEAADPLTQKKRELELLQTENAINEEKKKLSDSQPAPEPEPEPTPEP